MTLNHILVLLIGYVLGSIPFGVLVARARGVDIMKVGSGNTGATNVYRTLGKGPGLIVFILDVMKGVVPALIGHWLLKDKSFALYAGVAAMAGHSFSPFLKFKGGKGISTGLGALLGSTPLVALSALGAFCVVFAFTRWVSLGSLTAGLVLPIFGYLYGDPKPMLVIYVAICVFVFVKHRANIQRLLAGTEPKLNLRSKSEDSEQTEERKEAG